MNATPTTRSTSQFFQAKYMAYGLLLFIAATFTACTDGNNIDTRDAFAGRYNVTELCDSSVDTFGFTMNVRKLAGATLVELDEFDFYGYPYQPEAIISGDRLDIASQKYTVRTSPELSYEFTGTGRLVGNVLTIDYNVYRWEQLVTGMDVRLIDNCSMTCVKIVN